MSATFPLPEDPATQNVVVDRRFPARAPDTSTSGVSWGAITAGAAAAAALSFILLILGFGLGLSAVSPWSNVGVTAEAIGVSTIVWLAFTQIAASGVGGYLAGRLRVKWASVHSDEVYFRDTAHGLLAWAVASLATLTLLASTVSAVLGGGIKAGVAVASGASIAAGVAATQATDNKMIPSGYFIDSLFRSEQPPAAPLDPATRTEVTNIVVNGLRSNGLTPEDQQYLGKLVARQTGLTQAEAEGRVGEIYNRTSKAIAEAEVTAKQAADTARKTASYTSLWMFVALLCGAFFASLAATFGGKQRDHVA